MVEVGKHVGAAPPQRAAELGQFLERVGEAVAQGDDDRGHHGFAAAAVGLGVGGDQALVEAPAQLDREVGLIGENGFQSGFLARIEQRIAGAQRAPHTVERVTRAAAVPACLLLDALAAQVELGAGQRDDMEGIHDCGGLRQLICRRGLVAAEPVHHHDLHLVAKRLALLGQPAAQSGCRTSGD